ncbi:MAG: hypothetical protein KJ667_01820 [Alphaproteobacteria bacterium]|nr:hypothetical protein [Alphaproteobacteria bacterium]
MSTRSYYSEATLADLIGDVWRGKLFVLAGGLCGLALALLFLMLAVPHYRADMIVGPVVVGPADAAQADRLGFERFEAMMRGPSVAQRLRSQPALAAGIAADKNWRHSAAPKVENAAQVAEYLAEHIRIEPVGSTQLRRVTYDHPDAAFAMKLLQALYSATDALIHEENRRMAGERAEQLESTLAQTQNAEHRRTLTTALMGQEQARMMLDINQPFAAIVAEPPAASARPQWPRPVLVMPVLVMVGVFMGFAVSCLRPRK